MDLGKLVVTVAPRFAFESKSFGLSNWRSMNILASFEDSAKRHYVHYTGGVDAAVDRMEASLLDADCDIDGK